MPKATVRANARTTPKPEPGTVKSVQRQTAALNQGVALLKASQAADDEMIDAHNQFDRLYSHWLRARAAMWNPDSGRSEEECSAEINAVDEAARMLLATPVFDDEMFWKKWDVFEALVAEDAIDGAATDNRAVMALGCIKADLIRIGMGRAA